ncbi:MAG: hypothetical protein AB7N70_10915, partial [Dehalococcoidia bacterium]
GLALIPEMMVAEDVSAGRLAVINAPSLNSLLTLHLVRLVDSDLRDPIRTFIQVSKDGTWRDKIPAIKHTSSESPAIEGHRSDRPDRPIQVVARSAR